MLDENTKNIFKQIKDHPFLFEEDDLEPENLDRTEGKLPKDNSFFMQMQEDLSRALPNNTVLVEYLRVDDNYKSKILVSSAGSVDDIKFTFSENEGYITLDDYKLNDRSGNVINTLHVYRENTFSSIVKQIKEAYAKNS